MRLASSFLLATSFGLTSAQQSDIPTAAPVDMNMNMTEAPTSMNVTDTPTDSSTNSPTFAPTSATDAPTMMMLVTDAPTLETTNATTSDPSMAPSMMEVVATMSPIVTTVAPTNSSAPSDTPSMMSDPTSSPTLSVAPTISMSPSIPRQCSAYSSCEGLIDDCCPSTDDTFLYCCFEPEAPEQYEMEIGFVGPNDAYVQTEYLVSTSPYFLPATAPDGDENVVSYIRDPDEVFDMIYYTTEAISNASDYVDGRSKFYIDLYTTAPPCTQVLLQLDHLEAATPENYPIGRHSRYIALTTVTNEWQRLEFDFWDRPDMELSDAVVDAMALFFHPGSNTGDEYYFRNLDSAKKGCTGVFCETPVSPQACAALFDAEAGFCDDGIDNDNDGLMDCEDSECALDAACSTSLRLAYASAKSQVRSATDVEGDVEGDGSDSSGLMSSMIVGVATTVTTALLALVL